jgi:hypothetical protein|tara:strand:+ start:854 stop:1582 length:729 start_codon:yes stop_codon:yes gene_type:complete
MAGIRDIDSGKIYIGSETPKTDKSIKTLKGTNPIDGTLAVTGPAFIGNYEGINSSGKGRGSLNVGGSLGDHKVRNNLSVDVEGDAHVTGAITQDGNTLVRGALQVTEKITCGSLSSGLPKAFDIPHPNLKGMRLKHACPEGPEAAIYVRGKVSVDGIIELPDYWQNFVDKETISVHLTPIGAYQELFVDRIEYGKRVYVKNQAGGKIDSYYQVWANRADCSFEVEYRDDETGDDDHWFTSDT